MKHLQKNNPTIGAQEFSLVDMAGEDTYVYGNSPEITQIIIYKRADFKSEEPIEQLPQSTAIRTQYLRVDTYLNDRETGYFARQGTSTYKWSHGGKLYKYDLTDPINSGLSDLLNGIIFTDSDGSSSTSYYTPVVSDSNLYLDPLTLYAESTKISDNIDISWGHLQSWKPDKVEFQLEDSTLKITYVK